MAPSRSKVGSVICPSHTYASTPSNGVGCEPVGELRAKHVGSLGAPPVPVKHLERHKRGGETFSRGRCHRRCPFLRGFVPAVEGPSAGNASGAATDKPVRLLPFVPEMRAVVHAAVFGGGVPAVPPVPQLAPG